MGPRRKICSVAYGTKTTKAVTPTRQASALQQKMKLEPKKVKKNGVKYGVRPLSFRLVQHMEKLPVVQVTVRRQSFLLVSRVKTTILY